VLHLRRKIDGGDYLLPTFCTYRRRLIADVGTRQPFKGRDLKSMLMALAKNYTSDNLICARVKVWLSSGWRLAVYVCRVKVKNWWFENVEQIK
jgi:hypothetical protein